MVFFYIDFLQVALREIISLRSYVIRVAVWGVFLSKLKYLKYYRKEETQSLKGMSIASTLLLPDTSKPSDEGWEVSDGSKTQYPVESIKRCKAVCNHKMWLKIFLLFVQSK